MKSTAVRIRRSRIGQLAILSCAVSLFGLLPRVDLARANDRPALDPEIRRFEFVYSVEIPASRGKGSALDLFVPIASDTHAQRISSLEIDSGLTGSIERENVYGNRYWHAVLPANRPDSTKVEFRYEVERRVARSGPRDAQVPRARFLEANERVVVGDPMLEPILSEIRAASPGADAATRARAIYDWVVDNVEYKKVGQGWGNGDTFWACTERYGNCTDFHSLFISLARTEGIPARFEMGFPVPDSRSEGRVGGYHCWVEFWLPERGWVPIDASEAFKHPEKRELFFGTHPADRIHFSTGRDLDLGPAHRGRSLNYFVYPYVESNGARAQLDLVTAFSYRDLAPRVSGEQRAQAR